MAQRRHGGRHHDRRGHRGRILQLEPAHLTNVDGTLFFTASTTANGRELRRSDGTAAGTSLVADILPGAADSDPGDLTNVDGTLFFTASTPANGRELWRTYEGGLPVHEQGRRARRTHEAHARRRPVAGKAKITLKGKGARLSPFVLPLTLDRWTPQ